MKKIFILAFATLMFVGCGTSNDYAFPSDKSDFINPQEQKELNVIEAQKNKEIEVLNQQHDLRLQEESDRQASIDSCLAKARKRQKETINIALKQLGLNYEADAVAPERLVKDLNDMCQARFPQSALDCMHFHATYIREARTDYEADEANCYKRFK